jgi:hypothetical protein
MSWFWVLLEREREQEEGLVSGTKMIKKGELEWEDLKNVEIESWEN